MGSYRTQKRNRSRNLARACARKDRDAEAREMKEYRAKQATAPRHLMEQDPYFGSYNEVLETYIDTKPLQVGDQMLICNLQMSDVIGVEYELADVIAVNHTRQRRVVLSMPAAWGGKSFYRNGKNCYSPRGQSRMIAPIPAIINDMHDATVVRYGRSWPTEEEKNNPSVSKYGLVDDWNGQYIWKVSVRG